MALTAGVSMPQRMDTRAKLYARKILKAHVLLLLIVLVIVAMGARQIYRTARHEAIVQAGQRQELLARQTARAITSFYTSIESDLDLLRHTDAGESTTAPVAGGERNDSTRPTAAMQIRQSVGREFAFVPFLWNQLNGRVTALFVYDREARNPDRAFRMLEPVPTEEGDARYAQLLSEVQLLTRADGPWLLGVTQPSVSRLLPVRRDSVLQGNGGAGGVNLVCVPIIEGGRRLLIAVVSATEIQTRFLPQSVMRKTTGAALTDSDLAVMASTTPALVGRNLKEIDDADIRQMVADYATNPDPVSVPFEQPIVIEGSVLEPRLMTAEPVDLLQQRWCLLVFSPLADVDTVVQDVFRTVMLWAAFLVVSMTTILFSTAFQMIRSRTKAERIEHEAITRELTQARQIQLNWLPRQSIIPGFDISAVNHPASHISGDFYNWFDLPDGRQVITIGDVTGHGMAAAFLMATTQMLMRTTMPRVSSPGECLEEVNRQLCTQVFQGQFVTMLIVVLDLEKGVMEIATAGHEPPMLSQCNGSFEPLALRSQLVLAVDENQTYPTERFELALPACLLLYTDGVVDVQAENGERFDPEGLQRLLAGHFDSAQSMVDRVVEGVNAFRGRRELADDLTLVAVQMQPARSEHGVAEREGDARESMTVTSHGIR